MKLLLVTVLLACLLFGIIFSLDFFSGVPIQGLIWKTLNPFRVMEPAEYAIIFLFFFFFSIGIVGAYLNKKKKNDPSSN